MQTVLQKYGINKEQHFIGAGVECQAFHKGDGLVYKIYGKYNSVENMRRMQSFYNSLDTSQVSFKTPKILEIQDDPDFVIVVEEKLEGICPRIKFLESLKRQDLNKFADCYIELLFSSKNIKTDFLEIGEILDLESRIFKSIKYQSWNQFLLHNLEHRYLPVSKLFQQTVKKAETKFEILKLVLSTIELTEYNLIHGDISQNNILVNQKLEIASLYDFSSSTLMGDFVMEIAQGWALFDKFKEVNSFPIRKEIRSQILNKLSLNEQKRFAAYILFYSFVTANIFSNNDITEPNFQWCAGNLNNQMWWDMLVQ